MFKILNSYQNFMIQTINDVRADVYGEKTHQHYSEESRSAVYSSITVSCCHSETKKTTAWKRTLDFPGPGSIWTRRKEKAVADAPDPKRLQVILCKFRTSLRSQGQRFFSQNFVFLGSQIRQQQPKRRCLFDLARMPRVFLCIAVQLENKTTVLSDYF